MKPDLTHVDSLGEKSAVELAVWLLKGFGLINHPDKELRCKAFEPLDYFIGCGTGLTDDLKDIYGLLSEVSQKKFREAVTLAFSGSISIPYATISMKKSLLYLACGISAVEILQGINQQLSDNYLDTLEVNKSREWFNLLVNVVLSMAPGEGVAFTLVNLVASEYFDCIHAPAVLITLCDLEPGNFSLHMEWLRKSFIELRDLPGNMENPWTTARQIRKHVNYQILAAYEFQKGDEWLRRGFG